MSNSVETETQAEIAARVLAQKQRADADAPAHAEQAAEGVTPSNEGMTSTPRKDHPQSGAFGAEGQRPALERSRKVR